MISEYSNIYCKDEISKIENYDKAMSDNTQIWHCHHRLELTLNGEFAHSPEDLKKLGMYYNRPYFELIYLPRDEHLRLHYKANPLNDDSKFKISESRKGRPTHTGIVTSEFGIKFKEHYGITKHEDIKLYNREYAYFKRNNKCKWESSS